MITAVEYHAQCNEVRKAVHTNLDRLEEATTQRFSISLKEEVSSPMADGQIRENEFPYVITDSFFFIALVTAQDIINHDIGSEDNELALPLDENFSIAIFAL